MRLLIVSSCSSKKRMQSTKAPDCSALDPHKGLVYWREKLQNHVLPAREMYMGNQHKALVSSIDLLREVEGVIVDFYIVSAGFGILSENDSVPPYDCSFSGMQKSEICTRAEHLGIPSEFSSLCEGSYDLIYLALGKDYLTSLGSHWSTELHRPTLLFDKRYAGDTAIAVPCNAVTVRAFSQKGHLIHGVTGFKGDLLRILAMHALTSTDSHNEVNKWSDLKYLYDLVHTLGDIEQSEEHIQSRIDTLSS